MHHIKIKNIKIVQESIRFTFLWNTGIPEVTYAKERFTIKHCYSIAFPEDCHFCYCLINTIAFTCYLNAPHFPFERLFTFFKIVFTVPVALFEKRMNFLWFDFKLSISSPNGVYVLFDTFQGSSGKISPQRNDFSQCWNPDTLLGFWLGILRLCVGPTKSVSVNPA